jgi:nicotinamide-nucleotide amidase
MKAELVSIGTELLLGEITDTNATHIAQTIREIGLDLIYKTTVGDNEQRIAEVIDHALDRVDVVITSGGLGPTVDDVTREAIARATNQPLEFREDLGASLEEKFRQFGVKMSQNNERQAYVPQGAEAIDNPVGTAPIFILETDRGVVMTLPGVPREMKHLLEHFLLPWLKVYIGDTAVIRSRVLRTAGIGESQIDTQIADLMKMANPTVGLAAHTGQTDIRITAKAASDEVAKAQLDSLEAELRRRVGRWIYGTGAETLEEATMYLVGSKQTTIATVEVGTKGNLHERLKQFDQEGLIKHHQTRDSLQAQDKAQPLKDVALGFAQSARDQHRTDYGISVILGEAVTNTEEGTAIAVVGEQKHRVQTFPWRGKRSDAHIWAANNAMGLLRRMLLGSDE